MKFLVSSGKYSVKINKSTAYEAGLEAIGLWKYKKNKPDLSKITMVTCNSKTIYLSTNVLIEATNGF